MIGFTLNNLQFTNISQTSITTIFIIIFLMIFDFILKWIALYKSGKREEVARFICLLIFNTCGILPIIYLILNKENKYTKI